ncbi:MAG: Myo-inositol 2-dehydrogenase [Ilumatobacteraceae bacterium]|nr:Myo-inositol 2-dehydrogenase [Ilumatobacteraceae bacterium]
MAARRARVGLWGAGMISSAHGAAAKFLGMPIVGVASRTPERASTQAERLDTRAVAYADLPADAEIVIVSTPPQLHAADTIHLLGAGAAVVVEKPLCTTLADADALVAAAAASGQRVLYAENLAYAPMVGRLLAMAADLGPITHMEIRTMQDLPTWGEFTSDAWGGGALFDLGVHPLAIAVLAAGANGAGPVTSVAGTLRGGAGHNSDEHAEVRLTFAGGLVGTVVSSWQAGPGQVWDVQLSSATGVLRAEFWPTPTLEHNGEPVELPFSTVPIPFIQDLGYYDQLRMFADDIEAGRTPLMDVAFGRSILDIVCAAYWSAGHGGAPEPVPFSGPRDRTPLQLWHGQ